MNLSVNASNRIAYNNIANQISNYCYDSAGNLIYITQPAASPGNPCPTSGPYQYTYNAENQLTFTASVTYTYDGDGHRVQKSNGKLYWYGMGSDPLDETDAAGNTNNASFNEYIFFGGKRIARRDSTNAVNYYFADHLGTARIVANSSGIPVDDSDFYPFGGERSVTSTCSQNYKFTAKERDSESGLDNFGARYMGSSLGRFMSPDAKEPTLKHLLDPQKWNKYAYVLNNPLSLIDLDGYQEFTITVRRIITQSAVAPGAAGDNHKTGTKGTFRVEQKATIETDPKKNNGNPLVSRSETPGLSVGLAIGDKAFIPPGSPIGVGVGFADTSKTHEDAHRNPNGVVAATFDTDIKYPLTPDSVTPSITHMLVVTALTHADGSTTFAVSGNYSVFPGLEISVSQPGSDTETRLFKYDADSTLLNMIGPISLLCPDLICGDTIAPRRGNTLNPERPH